MRILYMSSCIHIRWVCVQNHKDLLAALVFILQNE